MLFLISIPKLAPTVVDISLLLPVLTRTGAIITYGRQTTRYQQFTQCIVQTCSYFAFYLLARKIIILTISSFWREGLQGNTGLNREERRCSCQVNGPPPLLSCVLTNVPSHVNKRDQLSDSLGQSLHFEFKKLGS